LPADARFARFASSGRRPRYHEERFAFLSVDPPSGFTGGCLTPRIGIMRDPAAPRCAALSAARGGFQEEREAFLTGTSAGGGANCEREARAAGGCRRGGAGAGIASASAAMSCD